MQWPGGGGFVEICLLCFLSHTREENSRLVALRHGKPAAVGLLVGLSRYTRRKSLSNVVLYMYSRVILIAWLWFRAGTEPNGYH